MFFGKSKNDLESLSRHPYSELPILIVSGMGRSGTTALRNAFALHPQVLALNRESNHIQGLLRQSHLDIEKPFLKKALPVNEKTYWQLHQQLILQLHWPSASIEEAAKGKAISTYSCLDPRGALGLSQAFSRSSVCHIVRNGIEVVASYRNFKHFAHLSFAEVCDTWAFQRHMMDYVASHRQQCTLLRYEWLDQQVALLEKALQESLDRIDLPWSETCLRAFEKSYHPTQSPAESAATARDRSRRSERWKEWSSEERAIFNDRCGDLMQALDYEIPWS